MTADSSSHTPPARKPIDLETYAILQECGFDEALLQRAFDPQTPSVPVTLRPYVPRPVVPQPATTRQPPAPRALSDAPKAATTCPNLPQPATTSLLQNEPTRHYGSQPSSPFPPLTPRQLHAARLLYAGHTARSAAATLNVNRHTISAWKKLPAFARELRKLQACPP